MLPHFSIFPRDDPNQGRQQEGFRRRVKTQDKSSAIYLNLGIFAAMLGLSGIAYYVTQKMWVVFLEERELE